MNPHSEAGDSPDQIWGDIHEAVSRTPIMNHIHKLLSWIPFTNQLHESESWTTFTIQFHKPESRNMFTIHIVHNSHSQSLFTNHLHDSKSQIRYHIHNTDYNYNIRFQVTNTKYNRSKLQLQFKIPHLKKFKIQLTTFIHSTISKIITLHKCESLLWNQNHLFGSLTFQTFIFFTDPSFILNIQPKHNEYCTHKTSHNRHHKLTHKQN